MIDLTSKEMPLHLVPAGVTFLYGRRDEVVMAIGRALKVRWRVDEDLQVCIVGVRWIDDNRIAYVNSLATGFETLVYMGDVPAEGLATIETRYHGAAPDSVVLIGHCQDPANLGALFDHTTTVLVIPPDNIQGLSRGQQELQKTDWRALRELERLLLAGTPLGDQREQQRLNAEREIASALPTP